MAFWKKPVIMGISKTFPLISRVLSIFFLITVTAHNLAITNGNISTAVHMIFLQLESPRAYFLGILKHTITMEHVQFFLFELLAFVNLMLWASIQRKLLLSLTEVLSGLRWNDADLGYDNRTTCSPELDDRRVENRHEDTQSLIWIVIPLYLSMYDSAPTEPLLVGIAIRSLPLALPFRFYLEWPTVSQHLLMLWAKVWLGETVLWTKSMISSSS
ncbi:hypothetical protein V8C44DRAFT_318245 [Trichoderma aethiopicum]